MRWTHEETEMLKTMTNEEIAVKTGRSIGSVANKRYSVHGTYSTIPEDYKTMGEYRILVLAKRLGVKLLGNKR